MEIQLSSVYYRSLKQFVKNNKTNAQNVKKALSILKNNPTHPSLNLEKLGGTKIWTIRVDKGNRIFFCIRKNIALLIDVGKHDKYRRY